MDINSPGYKSIKQKLFQQVCILLVITFSAVFAAVGSVQYSTLQKSLENTENNITNALSEKGVMLAANNAEALRTLVESNAFTDIQAVVSSTVREASDIIYGVYMTYEAVPWVYATPENPEGVVKSYDPLEDVASERALGVDEVTRHDLFVDDVLVYEFVAPVRLDEEIEGFIRYGITTELMEIELADARENARFAIIGTVSVMAFAALITLFIGIMVTRRLAARLADPIEVLTEAATVIAGGDYTQPVEVDTADEIGVLAGKFDRMRTVIDRKIEHLASIKETSEELAAFSTTEQALEEVIKTLCQAADVKSGVIYMVQDNCLNLCSAYPTVSGQSKEDVLSFSYGEGILGVCADNRQIVSVVDTSADDRFKMHLDHGRNGARSLFCIPLVDEALLLGVVCLTSTAGHEIFAPTDYEYCTSLAKLLAITVKKIQMRETVEEQNRTLEIKVKQRTQALAEKTNDVTNMLTNMQQGLFTITRDGTIHPEYSVYLETIFETADIKGRAYHELLFDGAAVGVDSVEQIRNALDVILGEDDLMFDLNGHLLINGYEYKTASGRTRLLELDWNPILLEGDAIVDKVMVTVRDVTQVKLLEAQAEESRRELQIIGKLLSIEADRFHDYIHNTMELIDQALTVVDDEKQHDTAGVELLFRNLHTVKGNARNFEFTDITDAAHEIEQGYQVLQSGQQTQWPVEKMQAELEELKQFAMRYEVINREKLQRGVEATSRQLDDTKIDEILEKITSISNLELPSELSTLVDGLQHEVASLSGLSLSDYFEAKQRDLDSMARVAEKPAPTLRLIMEDITIHKKIRPMFDDVFNHLLSNCLAHGIESVEERESKGKAQEGMITIGAEVKDHELLVRLYDDGKGLGIEHLREKARLTGELEADQLDDDQCVAETIFGSGVSTRNEVDRLSGRGVGMDAVRACLKACGGDIRIILGALEDQDAGYRPIRFEISLPKKGVMI